MGVMEREPVQALATAGGAAKVIVTLGTLFGLSLTLEQSAALIVASSIAVDFVESQMQRNRVYSPSSVKEFRRALRSYDAVKQAIEGLPATVKGDRDSVASALRALADEHRDED